LKYQDTGIAPYYEYLYKIFYFSELITSVKLRNSNAYGLKMFPAPDPIQCTTLHKSEHIHTYIMVLSLTVASLGHLGLHKAKILSWGHI
jgi:hypothetical protein